MARVLGRLALSVASLVACLLLLEVGARWLAAQDLDFFNSHRFLAPVDGRFERLLPHAAGNYVGVPVSINGLGMRDREVAVPKPAGVFRVQAIGDSVTFGFGVRLEDTWVKQLEARLRAQFPGRTVEVVNAAMGNTGLDYYLHVLQTQSAQLGPDLVLVGLVLNDIMEYDAPITGGWNASPRLGRLHYALITHSHLYLLSYARVKSALYRRGWLDINATHAHSLLAVAPVSDRQRRAWASSLALLEALIAEARDRNISLALVVFPELLWAEALLLAVILAPTDAALGQALPAVGHGCSQGGRDQCDARRTDAQRPREPARARAPHSCRR